MLGVKTKRQNTIITVQFDTYLKTENGATTVITAAVRLFNSINKYVYIIQPKLTKDDLNYQYPAETKQQTWRKYVSEGKDYLELFDDYIIISHDMLKELFKTHHVMFLVHGESKQIVHKYTNLATEYEVKELTLDEMATGVIGYSKVEMNEISQAIYSLKIKIRKLVEKFGTTVMQLPEMQNLLTEL